MSVKLDYFWHKKTVLSFLAVFLVITIHNSATNQYQVPPDNLTTATDFIRNFFSYNLGAVAVPFFFLVSGIALFRNYKPSLYKQKLTRRTKTLLIPYLIWNIIGLLFAIAYTYTPLSHLISGREAFTPTLPNILEGIFLYKYNYSFWFMYALIIFVVLTPLFHLLLSRKWLGLLSCAGFLCLCLIDHPILGLDLSFLVFYFLGCYIGKYHLPSFTKAAKPKFSTLAGLITLIILILRTFVIYNFISLPTIIYQITLLLLLLSLWFFVDIFITKIKPHKYMDEFFPIYTIHPYFIAIITKIIYLALPTTSFMLLINELTSPILTLLIVILIASFWHHKLPKSYSVAFGRPTRTKNPTTEII